MQLVPVEPPASRPTDWGPAHEWGAENPSGRSQRSDDAAVPVKDAAPPAPETRTGGRGDRVRPARSSAGDRLLREDPRVLAHLRLAALAAGPLAVVVVVQGFALAALVVAVAQHGRLDALAAALLAGAAVIRGAAGWWLERSGRRATAGAIGTLRDRLVRDASTLAVATPGALRPGEVTADVVQHLPAIEQYVGRFLSARPTAAATTVIVLIAVAFTDPLSAFLLAPTVPLLILFLWLVGSEARAAADARLASLQLLGAHLLDVLRGLTDLRAFGRAGHQRTQVQVAAAHYRVQTMVTLRSAFLSGLVLELVAMLGTALVAVFGGVRLAAGDATLAAILPALVLAPELYAPLRRLGAGYHDAADARAALDRLAAVAEAAADAPQPGRPGGPLPPHPAAKVIVLDDVSVGGGSGNRPQRLTGVSLTLIPGLTALVGPSGSGKSTLSQLVLGLLRPTSGRVLASGVDLSDVDLDGWRAHCAWVAQDPVLLPTTLRENARLGRPDAPDEDVSDALADAGLGPLTAALPGGLDCMLGDGAALLSTGELRRLAMARAIVAGADLIVFDEPTAGLDALTAQRLRSTMLAVAAGRTALLITHDPDLARCADEIVELAGGAVVEVRKGGGALAGAQADAATQSDAIARANDAAQANAIACKGTADAGVPARITLRSALRLLASEADRPVRRRVAVAITYGTLSAVAAVAVLALSGGLIVKAALRPPVLELTMVIVLVRMFSIVRATTRYGERLASHDAALRVLEGVRVRVFARSAKAVPGGAGERSTAALDRAVGDVDRAADLFIRVLVPSAASVAAIALAVAIAALFSPLAAVILAASMAVLGTVVTRTARRAGSALASAEPARAELATQIAIALDAGPELLLAGRTAEQVQSVGRIARPLEAAAALHGTRNAALAGLVTAGAALTAVAVAAAVSDQVAAGALSGPIAAGLILGALACAERLDGLADAGLALPASTAAVARLAPALRSAPDSAVTDPRTPTSVQSNLTVDRLTLTRGPRTIVDGVSLTVAPGECVALTGESGAGKSTLLLALAGLLPVHRGCVRVAGQPVATFTERERAALVLLVPSLPHLFGATLAANLRLADPAASDVQLKAALVAVGLGGWLGALPHGLETQLAEGGLRASGGERQRIGLARAWLSPAQIVLLDEPASHLPEPAALAALQAVIAAQPGRGALLVSHRDGERRLASREVRLAAGRVAPQHDATPAVAGAPA